MVHEYVCKRCKRPFKSSKKGKQYCTHDCFAKRFGDVTKTCPTCGNDFTVAYRFREQKTCGMECAKTAISKTLTTRETKQCLNPKCNKQFEVTQSYKDDAKYCSYDCFLDTRKTRQPDVVKNCEHCKEEFTVPFTRSEQRFCGHSCASTGENNGMFDKPGPRTGKQAWSHGLSKEDDPRLAAMGQSVSVALKEQFASGERSHRGENNPNFGNVAATLTPEKRRNFSVAAIKRVVDGVSGYKTGHLTGMYLGKKTGSTARFKSSWELAAMMWWDRDSTTMKYEYEPRTFELADGRRAIPDFLVTSTDGTQRFVEIKPTAIQELASVKEKLDLVRVAVVNEGYDYVLLGNDVIKQMMKEMGDAYDDEVKRYQGGSADVLDCDG